MKTLNIECPDVLTRVTDYIPEIIEFIQKLIDKELAYITETGVYFDVGKYKQKFDYPVMAMNMSTESDDVSEENTLGKRNRKDFVLWKLTQTEPSWSSPCFDSPGRMGWHIECSTFSSIIFGDSLDIHLGGIDLKFPHHCNEIAQCQGLYDKPWTKYFLHIGHLSIDGLKMSKSLKNFISIQEFLTKYSSESLRMYFSLSKYNSPLSFSFDEVRRADEMIQYFKRFIIKGIQLDIETKWTDQSCKLYKIMLDVQMEIQQSLNDDFDLPNAIHSLTRLVTTANTLIGENNIPVAVKIIANYVQDFLTKIGFNFEDKISDHSTQLINSFVNFRNDLRKSDGSKKTLFKLTDQLRDEIFPNLGFIIEDQGTQSTWSPI